MRALISAKYDYIFESRKLMNIIVRKWLLILIQKTKITIYTFLYL